MLSIPAEKFMKICEKFPLVKETLIARAIKRKEMFENYKTELLIKYMRAVLKNPVIASPVENLEEDKEMHSKYLHYLQIIIDLMNLLVKQYEYARWLNRIQGNPDADKTAETQDSDSEEEQEIIANGVIVQNKNKQKRKREKALRLRKELLEAKRQAIQID
jgi:hypothetical protein